MFNLITGILGILMGFFGIVSNLYILLVIVFSKKARSISEWILLHLSSCGIGASILIVCFTSPSIILGTWISTVEPLCDIVGASILTLQLLTVWSICALSVDRCSAIVSPLRYTQVVTRKRVAAFFVILWCLCITMITMAFSISSAYVLAHKSEPETADVSFLLNNNAIHPQKPTTIPNDLNLMNEYHHEEHGSSDIKSHRMNEQFKFTTSGYQATNYRQNNQLFDLYFSNQRLTIKNMNKTVNVHDIGHSHMEQRVGEDDGIPQTQTQDLSDYDDESSTFVYSSEDILKFRNLSTKKYHASLGFCLPSVYYLSWVSFMWIGEWFVFIFVAPLCTLLICDLTVLSIAKKQRHRIVMALYQITLSAQATVVRNKGTAPPSLWMNSQAVPAKSNACRAVWEDLATIIFLNLPLIIILVIELIFVDVEIPLPLTFLASLSFFLTPSFTSLLHGVRARPLRTAYKSYLRKRLTNSTLQHEIEQRLSPVDGSPRASSRAKSFRSSTPSPNSSPFQTPHRRLSTNDLRPPTQFSLTLSPSHYQIASCGDNNHTGNHFMLKPRKVRSFLHIPSQQDMQEFWSGLRKPNRSPTIIITHELRSKRSSCSFTSSDSSTPPLNAEHLV